MKEKFIIATLDMDQSFPLVIMLSTAEEGLIKVTSETAAKKKVKEVNEKEKRNLVLFGLLSDPSPYFTALKLEQKGK